MDIGIEMHFRDEAIYDAGEASGISKGISQGISQGILQGIDQTKRDVVLSMYENNEPLEKISKYNRLSISKIKKIIKSANKKNN